MMAMIFRTFKIKVLVFSLSNLLSIRDLVNTLVTDILYENYIIKQL